MGIRWKSEDLLNAYGVYGSIVESDGSVVVQPVLDRIVSEADFPLTDGGSPPQNYLTYALSGAWRFSVELLTSNPEFIQQFYTPLGVKKLGRWSVERAEYTTYEGFWSFDKYISPKFIYTAIILRNLSPEPGEPSFEILPPSSLPQAEIPEIDPPYLIAYSQSDGTSGGYNNRGNSIGDTFFLSVEPGVISYRLGVTYDYFIQPFTAPILIGTSGLAAYLI